MNSSHFFAMIDSGRHQEETPLRCCTTRRDSLSLTTKLLLSHIPPLYQSPLPWTSHALLSRFLHVHERPSSLESFLCPSLAHYKYLGMPCLNTRDSSGKQSIFDRTWESPSNCRVGCVKKDTTSARDKIERMLEAVMRNACA
jgi:hypothetical protein